EDTTAGMFVATGRPMPRRRRIAQAGVLFHAMNRAAKKWRLFDSHADYRAFVDVAAEAVGRFDVSLFAYIVMPNHFHFVLSPRTDGALSPFMHWMETTHARRW